MTDAYDIIIIGGGSAGCVLANRLSARSATRVLLIEAGRDTAPGSEPADVLDTYPVSYYNLTYAWSGLAGHWRNRESSPKIGLRQARILGGGSSVMGMVALRGTPHDYAEWLEQGAEGWGWDDVLPYFRKLETDTDFGTTDPDAQHSADGPVPIRRLPEEKWPPILKGLAASARNSQIQSIADFNGDFRDGFGPLPISRFADKRASSAICYLDAATRARANLSIATETEVARLIFDGRRVTGVDLRTHGGALRRIAAAEVIVAAGALQSPVMLMRSGIGPAAHLKDCGVSIVVDRPGVGANLHNHQILYLIAHLRRSAVPPATARAHTTATWRYSSGVADCPPSDMFISFVGQTGWHELGRRLCALTPAILKPFSRGRIRLDPAAPDGPADIVFDFQSDPRDTIRHKDAVRRAASWLLSPEVRPHWLTAVPIARTDRMRQLNDITTWNTWRARAIATVLDWLPQASRPIVGTMSHRGLDVGALLQDDDALTAFVREGVTGMAHHAGTCRMGRPDDPMSVVDRIGRVYGIAGLRVVDASVMPWVPRGNTNIPTIMIAEKIAADMLAEHSAAA